MSHSQGLFFPVKWTVDLIRSMFETPHLPDPAQASLEYLDYVQRCPDGFVDVKQVRQHVLYHFEREE